MFSNICLSSCLASWVAQVGARARKDPLLRVLVVAAEWFHGVPKELYLSRKYDTRHNAYRVKSGLDQAGWESSGWINECDPRGWTQWYFRFFNGRRLSGGGADARLTTLTVSCPKFLI